VERDGMQCPACSAEAPADAKFCPQCGARQTLVCAQCGTTSAAGDRFCKECGQSFATAPEPSTRFASLQSYTPKHLAEKILTSKAALEGERKQVTVLFADLKGSMELLADRDPEEARKLLDPVLERMMEAVHHYEGTVNQVMGDGIMALFGAPIAHEDHGVRACYAALAMQAAIRRYSEEVRRSHGIAVQVRVGLNSGEVVVRAIGNDLHMDYSAIGQTTHLAARMEQLASPGSTLLTTETLRLAEGFVQVTSLGPVPVRGLPDAVGVFELIGASPMRTRMQAVAARGLTRFVGRQTELEALSQALKLAGAGHGQVLALVGEPGVGKSRLVWEFTHSYRTDGWLLLESGSVSYGKATAYRPVIDLLKAYFQIEDRDDGRKIREKLTGKLLTLDKALEPTLPAFLALLDVPVEEREWQVLDPPQRRQRTLDACKRLLLRESQVQPLLLVFEDLHWIDTETQAFLDSLIESIPTARLLLLVNYRPEYQQGWASKTYYTQIRIDPLPPASAEELLQALLGDDPGLQPCRQFLIERTGGNPFFLEESVRTLIDTKVLVGERGAYRLATALAAVQVPTTVQAVLAARIDRLPPEEKRLLQAASVVGKDVPFAILQAIAELSEEDLRRGLTHLQAAEFFYETSLFPDLEYTFKHALTHEVAYASLLQERRRITHARIMEAIETLYAGRLAEHVERLGHHAFRGEVWEKALQYLRQAGAKAFDRSANREAVACQEQALEALRHLPETREALEQAIDLRFDLRNPMTALGALRRLRDHLQEAERLADTLGDQRRLGRVANYLSILSTQTGEYARGIDFGKRALAVGEALGDLDIRAVANLYIGMALAALGNYSRAVESFTHTTESLAGDLNRERFGQTLPPAVLARGWKTWSLALLGRFADAIACGEEAIQIADTGTHAYSRAYAMVFPGHAYLLRGDLDRATRLLEQSLALCRATDMRFPIPLVAAGLGRARALMGRLPEALALLDEAVGVAVSMTHVFHHSLFVGLLGEACLLAGRRDDAIEHATHALDLCRRWKERGLEALTLRLLAEIASDRDPPEVENAEEHYRQALALAHELGMRPLVAHCHLGLGKLYRRVGKREQARDHLGTATTLYREMDMRFWLEQAEAEMAIQG
jgi:predicted ATPase/class 3 adenylate cyclase